MLRRLTTTASGARESTPIDRNRLTRALSRLVSKAAMLPRTTNSHESHATCEDALLSKCFYQQPRYNICSSSTTDTVSILSPSPSSSSSTIFRMREPTSSSCDSYVVPSSSATMLLPSFAIDLYDGIDNDDSATRWCQVTGQGFPTVPVHRSPWQPPFEQAYSPDECLSNDTVLTSTISVVFDAYTRPRVMARNDQTINEPGRYVPTIEAMVHNLSTKPHSLPVRASIAVRRADSLRDSCSETSALLASGNMSSTVALHVPKTLNRRGTSKLVPSNTNTRFENQQSLRQCMRKCKRDLKCRVADLIVKIPSRRPRWLIGRALTWTIVSEYERLHSDQGSGFSIEDVA